MSCSRTCTTLPPPSSGTIRTRRRGLFEIDECSACYGAGRNQAIDHDDGDKRLIEVICEFCDGSGQLASCVSCCDLMPAPVAEAQGFLCAGCREHLGGADADDERAELRRTG